MNTCSMEIVKVIVEIVTAIVAIVGVIAAYIKWDDMNRFRRCTVTYEIIRQFYDDKEVREILYMIEYENWEYNKSFHGSKDEHLFDKTFSYLDNIAKLKKEGVLGSDDYGSVFYLMHRLCGNSSVQSYLWNVHHFSLKSGAKDPFGNLVGFAKENGCLDNSFFNNVATGDYKKKVLNF